MSRPANTAVAEKLRKKILSGAFEKTTFLPPERQLAEELQVGRAIIRGVLKTFGEEKIIYKVPKRGWRLFKREERRLKRILLRLSSRMNAEGYEGMGLVAGICSGANDIYAEVILSSPPMELDKKELLERYNAGDIQGIIFLEAASDVSIRQLLDSGIPCVVANLEEDLQLPCVRMDYHAIGAMAGKELLDRGYRNMAVYGGSLERFIYKELLAGFREIMDEAGIALDGSRILCGEDELLQETISTLLKAPAGQRPEAFFTLRDYRAGRLFESCAQYGLKIPEDVGIISYDDISWPAARRQGLSSIREDVYRIGKESVLMLQKIYESGPLSVESISLPGVLAERTSLKRLL